VLLVLFLEASPANHDSITGEPKTDDGVDS
jgi:hypothetical protein